ncbi:GNAT family N-acetyltransferase [Halorussus halophilus]|uniref:GNAT family N-acetyltransferase n=1 Tax=Halorussus halophilus TaxID=2650975 RepID=UPI001300DD53|nr:GNAT family N-acetyltransferase [Halorussus halophilus]
MIRPARSSDRSELRDIQQSLREPNPPLLEYAIEGPPLLLVSTADGEPVGYALVFYDDETGYVAELAVLPSHRREGRASRLLAAIFERLRDEGCKRVSLSVHPDDEAAQQFYGSLGFETTGREPDYYEDGSEAVVMEHDL